VERATPGHDVTTLDEVRDDFEHRRGDPPECRDPFQVDRERAAEALTATWGDSYAISATETGFKAVRHHGQRVTLEAGTPDELVREMTEDAAW
jgi:hypothetical protein